MLKEKTENFPFFSPIQDQEKDRTDLCSCCGHNRGKVISKINYIGLIDTDLVQCPKCAFASFDPIPSSETTGLGCSLLYRIQETETSKKKILRGFARSFRRGGNFARKYLKKINGLNHNSKMDILEIGAGDGYFSQGVANEYPESKITYIDIVDDLRTYYKGHFPSDNAITGELSNGLVEDNSFDLIIIRDLLEHLRNPALFLEQTNKALRKGGLIFIITPNGWEDVWPAYQYASFREKEKLETNPYVIYLNHFHYFMPSNIVKFLENAKFEIVTKFKYGLKQHKRGLGLKKMMSKDMERPNLEKEYLEKGKSFLDQWEHDPKFIQKEWLHNGSFFSKIYSKITDKEKDKVDFFDQKGHEFFIIARKI